jgi:hypothetical protein
MIIRKHDQEANLLRRRLELLEILDDLIRSGAEFDEPLDDDARLKALKREFADVLEPEDLITHINPAYLLRT